MTAKVTRLVSVSFAFSLVCRSEPFSPSMSLSFSPNSLILPPFFTVPLACDFHIAIFPPGLGFGLERRQRGAESLNLLGAGEGRNNMKQ